MDETPKAPSRYRDLYAILHDFVYILAAITLIFVFLIRLQGISGPSMTPTLRDGEYVVLLSNFVFNTIRRATITHTP